MTSKLQFEGADPVDQIAKPDLVAPGNTIISALSADSTIVTKYPGNVVPQTITKGTVQAIRVLVFQIERDQHGGADGGRGRS